MLTLKVFVYGKAHKKTYSKMDRIPDTNALAHRLIVVLRLKCTVVFKCVRASVQCLLLSSPFSFASKHSNSTIKTAAKHHINTIN